MRHWRVVALAAAALAAAALSGCLGAVSKVYPPSKEKTPLEKALDENRQLKASLATETQLNHNLAYNLEMARMECRQAQAAAAVRAGKPAPVKPMFEDFNTEKLALGILTGPAEWNGDNAYDGIMAYLEPLDGDGSVVKRKGAVAFDLIDVSDRREKRVMSWEIPASRIGAEWSPIPPAFRIKLPWQGEVPWGRDLIFRATFTDVYGRTFSASRAMTLKPMKNQ